MSEPNLTPPVETVDMNVACAMQIEARGRTADLALENLAALIRAEYPTWTPCSTVTVCRHHHPDDDEPEYHVATLLVSRTVTLPRWRDPIADAF